MNRNELVARLKQNAYYIIIFIVSVLAITFLPMIGSTVDITQNLPTTEWEWLVFIFIRCTTGALNVCIFASFLQQAKVNVKDDPNYQEANRILNQLKKKREVVPRSPKKFIGMQWGRKGSILLVSSISATFVLSNIILTFDYIQVLVYIFVIAIGIVFGYMTMKRNEIYRTTEYLEYALFKQAEELKGEQECLQSTEKLSETYKSKS